jgi:hypothetical protein
MQLPDWPLWHAWSGFPVVPSSVPDGCRGVDHAPPQRPTASGLVQRPKSDIRLSQASSQIRRRWLEHRG